MRVVATLGREVLAAAGAPAARVGCSLSGLDLPEVIAAVAVACGTGINAIGVRAADGRGAPTSLQSARPAFLRLPSVRAVTEALHVERIPADDPATLTPVLFAAADAGDAAAGAPVDRQAEEIGALALTALRRLDLLETPVPVVLGGGVLAAGHERLLAALR